MSIKVGVPPKVEHQIPLTIRLRTAFFININIL